jgi:hypothetical protein
MTMTLRLSPEEEKKLMERASESGQDVTSYVQRLIARDIERAETFAELLAPIHEDFRKSGMTEEELETLLESELAEARKERRKAKDRAQQVRAKFPQLTDPAAGSSPSFAIRTPAI